MAELEEQPTTDHVEEPDRLISLRWLDVKDHLDYREFIPPTIIQVRFYPFTNHCFFYTLGDFLQVMGVLKSWLPYIENFITNSYSQTQTQNYLLDHVIIYKAYCTVFKI